MEGGLGRLGGGASLAWPAVMVKARGRARLSEARWTLVLSSRGSVRVHDRRILPAEPPFVCSGGMLMGPHDGGFDRPPPNSRQTMTS